ncbi:hypothetical protein OKA04_04505 [Luteolibacter flavescens]|uniref:Integrase n=1 Tax=Luteolibacter flavescens TaxID=1859460 RepID=A0ABT3FK96_9BACT|nr:hypothetical protein [Luteolibacter flavescens]MCW1883977.1 hypothetical protein [Luteolibacter flavescens]
MAQSQPDKELPLGECPRWTVIPVFHKLTAKERKKGKQPTIKHWSLRYDGRCRQTAISERDIERLREIARLLNARNARPADVKASGLQLDMFPELTPPPAWKTHS